MSLVQTTPEMRKFALILAYWMGHVVHRMQTSDRDFKAVENVEKELVRYSQAGAEPLENRWEALTEATRKVEVVSFSTRAAVASASAMQAMVEDNKGVAARRAARAWQLGVKALTVHERNVNEAVGLECAIFLTIANDLDAASKMLEPRECEQEP